MARFSLKLVERQLSVLSESALVLTAVDFALFWIAPTNFEPVQSELIEVAVVELDSQSTDVHALQSLLRPRVG